MRQIGKIKWFGGYNSRTGQDNEFGFVEASDGTDLFIHLKNVLCNENDLDENTFVTFTVEPNPRNGKLEAKQLKLLMEETDIAVLATGLQDGNDSIRLAVLSPYLACLASQNNDTLYTEEQSALLAQALTRLDAEHRLPMDLLKLIPLQMRKNMIVFSFLPPEEKFKYLISEFEKGDQTSSLEVDQIAELISASTSTVTKQKLIDILPSALIRHPSIFPVLDATNQIKQLVYRLGDADETGFSLLVPTIERIISASERYYRRNLTALLPPIIQSQPAIFPFLEDEQKIAVLISQLALSQDNSDLQSLVQVISGTSVNSSSRDRLLRLLPPELRYHAEILPLNSSEEQIRHYLQNINENFTDKDQALAAIALIVQQAPPDSDARELLLDLLPDQLRQSPVILPLTTSENQLKALVSQIGKHNIQGELIDKIVEILARKNQSERNRLLDDVPERLKFSPGIFPLLDFNEQIRYLVSQLTNSSNIQPIVESIAQIIKQASETASKKDSLIELIPESLDGNELIRPLLPLARSFRYLISQIPIVSDPERVLREVSQILMSAPDNREKSDRWNYEGLPKDEIQTTERDRLVSLIPSDMLMHPIIYPALPANRQFYAAISNKKNWVEMWPLMSQNAKIMAIFQSAKDRVILPIEHLNETNPVIQTLLIFYWAGGHPERKVDAFEKAHQKLQEFVIGIAWLSDENLDFGTLLPYCTYSGSDVAYCEGRRWEKKGKTNFTLDTAFCPRIGGECRPHRLIKTKPYHSGTRRYSSYDDYGPKSWGSHVTPDTRLEVVDWTLFELLAWMDINPNLSELRSPLEYVPKLAGWINRLNEIRARMKCSKCGKIMRPNYKYAKNLARYNMTVVTCDEGPGHDNNIYLNHCWACGTVIDSRESSFRVYSAKDNFVAERVHSNGSTDTPTKYRNIDATSSKVQTVHESIYTGEAKGLYICLTCGSGPQQKDDFYSHGDICPKCGEPNMTKNNAREFKCSRCNHTIAVPKKLSETDA